MRGVRQKFLSRMFFFAPSRIRVAGSEGEGVGGGVWNLYREGTGSELCKGGSAVSGRITNRRPWNAF